MGELAKSTITAKQLIEEALAEQRLFTPVAEFSRRHPKRWRGGFS